MLTFDIEHRVILMSATVDSARFSQYFSGCPVLEVPGRTFPVHAQFLEDVIDTTGYTLEEDSEYAIRLYKDIRSIYYRLVEISSVIKFGTSILI